MLDFQPSSPSSQRITTVHHLFLFQNVRQLALQQMLNVSVIEVASHVNYRLKNLFFADVARMLDFVDQRQVIMLHPILHLRLHDLCQNEMSKPFGKREVRESSSFKG